MSEIKQPLQWVAVYNDGDNTRILHQFDEEGNQLNINELLSLSDENKLGVLIIIPRGQRMGTGEPIGNPFFAVSMEDGLFNINGTTFNFSPEGVDFTGAKYRPIFYHTTRKDYNQNMILISEYIVRYKFGWQTTIDGKNYQRIIFFDLDTGICYLKEKR